MAGIYLHIPFCRQACHYCDFHFSTSLKSKNEFLYSLKKEIFLHQEYLETKKINTVYFGGGTPSILSKDELLEIFSQLSKYFSIDSDAEITLEANPDDLSKQKLKELSHTPVNRLSIGIQSFSNEDLKFLNRVHDSSAAIASVQNAQDAGFINITIDLIYGIQTLSTEQWKKNLEQAFALNVQHLSCYSLTVEPKTPLASFIKEGKMQDVSLEKSAEQFEILMAEAKKNNFIHYEISNFGKDGFFSRHNSNYWKGEKYLGLGPSAHSFDGNSRQWNAKSNSVYINSLSQNKLPFEKEILTENQKYNEYILTSLRTMWGIDLNYVRNTFGKEKEDYLLSQSNKYVLLGELMLITNSHNLSDGSQFRNISLSARGKLFADKIASDLFII